MGRKRTDAIRDFLEGSIHYADLRRPEREYLDQMKMVEAMWANGKPDNAIRNALSEQYHISDNTARQTLRDCALVFGDLKDINRKMMRYRASQMAVKAYEMAELAGDYKAMIGATKAFTEANGINNEDPETPDFEKIEAGAIITMLPEGMEDMIGKLLAQSGVLDLTELPDLTPEPDTIDISYEPESETTG